MGPTVAACQCAVTDLAVEQNLTRIIQRVRELPDRVDVACFPEYAVTGFVPDERVYDVAVDSDGSEIARLQETATTTGTDLLIGCIEAAPNGDHPYNAAVYLGSQGTRTVYRKRHRWDAERELLARGVTLPVFETPCGTTAVLTCYDLNFVTDSASLTEQDVDTLLVPGAWPLAHAENWRLLLRARALDGVRWVVGVGRTGGRNQQNAPNTTYAGQSLVVRPDGSVAKALDRSSETLIMELDPEVQADARQQIGIYSET